MNTLHLALHAAARALAGHAVVFRAEAAKLHRVHVNVVDIDVTAVNTGLGGTATAVGTGWYASDVDVTAVNTGLAGTAVAVADVHRARDVDVTAVNAATLGTAVAVATPAPAPRHSTKDTSSNVTAVNTGILGTAIAVGGGGNGDVTTVNTGILGTAIAVGGGGSPGYPELPDPLPLRVAPRPVRGVAARGAGPHGPRRPPLAGVDGHRRVAGRAHPRLTPLTLG